ncbi:4a-hydroxytetrahydrobiopterin dehydratase [Angomonas deanei]|nr:4a-hydroxytetrahydrobiopterin dehydratase [Angomonas deanei]|eukprot:EPY36014.1 4a-hydroxytetrahydrobiopterin dehydratase [Angomonas deanei]
MDGNSTRHIERDLLFVDFVAAMKFMQEVAPVCEKMGHHPMWLNVYNRVHVKLTTHDAGNAVSQKDVDLAKVMNETYAKYTKKK